MQILMVGCLPDTPGADRASQHSWLVDCRMTRLSLCALPKTMLSLMMLVWSLMTSESDKHHCWLLDQADGPRLPKHEMACMFAACM